MCVWFNKRHTFTARFHLKIFENQPIRSEYINKAEIMSENVSIKTVISSSSLSMRRRFVQYLMPWWWLLLLLLMSSSWFLSCIDYYKNTKRVSGVNIQVAANFYPNTILSVRYIAFYHVTTKWILQHNSVVTLLTITHQRFDCV